VATSTTEQIDTDLEQTLPAAAGGSPAPRSPLTDQGAVVTIHRAMNYGPVAPRVIGALALAAGFEGLRAGAGTFRALLDLPARTRVGPLAFAEFSRATDLSTTGIVFYVVFGIGGALLTAAVWFIAVRGRAPALVRGLLATSTIASVLVLVLTARAAPLMWQVGSAPPDPALVRGLLDRFTAWTMARVACVNVSFAAVLAALTWTAMSRNRAT